MKTPTYVPLPEVASYTDQIAIESLGIPIGFDETGLGVNVRAIHKVMQWGGINYLTIKSEAGKSRNENPGIGGIGEDGTLAGLGFTSPTPKLRLQRAELDDNYGDIWPPEVGIEGIEYIHYLANKAFYGKPHVIIRMNNTEKEARINEQQKRWPRGLSEPGAQAHFINIAVRDGLKEAILKSHSTPDKFAIATGATVAAGLGGVLGSLLAGEAITLPELIVVTFLLQGVHSVYVKKKYGLGFTDRQWSIGLGLPLDRQAIARLHATRTMVRSLG